MDTGKGFRVKYLFQSSLNGMKIGSLVQENFAPYQVLKSLTFFSFVMKKKSKTKINGGSGLQQLQSLAMLLSEAFCAYSHSSSLAVSHGLNCNHRNGAHFIW